MDEPPPASAEATRGESPAQLRTERLLLRPWRDGDREPFAAINADPVAMEHFPSTLTRAESDGFAEWIERQLDRDRYGLWAVEIPGEASFVGFVGIVPVGDELPFAPATEVGWRLAREHWGRGIAIEAARAALAFGFEELALEEIVAITTPSNVRSRRVMERLGMRRDAAGDFEHPKVPAGHPLAAHVLYRLQAARWRISSGSCAGATPTPPGLKN
jgi:ribosomal-protein-alanine N-acetyltransferase